ncbi:MAG: single-stranded-DNA-specific exonuclease RecJ [Clostridia bacterium]|nr:single-stranded-DNA-specific exonuclease RecJ [Clostridia bacterium]
MISRKIWNVRKLNFKLQEQLASELNISSTLAMLLINRGYSDINAARQFLEPSLVNLVSPFKLTNMAEAIEKIRTALKEKKPIVIYGDYDVDGITGTALLTEVFTSLGVDVRYYIPDRMEEGYGLNCEAISSLARQGAQLIITVDCGISSKAEVELGKKLGLDFIITDHHQPPEELPDCLIINPHLEKEPVPWRDLAGVGVAFKVAQALLETFLPRNYEKEMVKYLDLAALGTVADIVPLVGENRIIVKFGLEQIALGKRIGLKALCERAGIDCKNITSSSVGYILAPRLNACGRIGDATLGVRLLLTDNEKEAQEIAQCLNQENQNRQNIESKIIDEAVNMLRDFDFDKNKVIVLKGEDWHQGVIGIVASRLVDKYYRPVIILTKQNDIYKGSGRSIPGFHLHQALTKCEDLLEAFGGHSQAAGLSLKEDKIEPFIERINSIAWEVISEEQLFPTLDVDGEINLAEINFKVLEEISKLEPFGHANPEPLLVYRRSKIKEWKEVGSKGGHLKIKVLAGNTLWDAIGFNMAGYQELAAAEEPLDLAFVLDKNQWNGKTTLQLVLKDLKPHKQWDNPFRKPDFLESLFLEGYKYLGDLPTDSIKEYESFGSKTFSPANQEKLVFIDVRGYNDKIKYIKNVIPNGQKSIIYVNNRMRAYNLAADLRRDLVAYREKIAYFHGGLTDHCRLGINELLLNGQLQVLVTTGKFALVPGMGDIEDIIFFDLCFSREQYNYILGWAGNNRDVKAKIHLLYGPRDKEFNWQHLSGIAPEREQLAKFYLLLKKISEKTNPVILTGKELAEWANHYKISGAQAEYMEIWLRIFQN